MWQTGSKLASGFGIGLVGFLTIENWFHNNLLLCDVDCGKVLVKSSPNIF